MYEAPVTRGKIRKVLLPFFGTSKNMQQPEFSLKGHRNKLSNKKIHGEESYRNGAKLNYVQPPFVLLKIFERCI